MGNKVSVGHILDIAYRDGQCLYYGDVFPDIAKSLAIIIRDELAVIEVTWNISFGWSECDDPRNTIVFKVKPKNEETTM